MKTFKRNIALFLLFSSVITFNGAEFFHHHHKSALDDENHCQACIFHSVLNSIEPCDAAIDLATDFSYKSYTLLNYSIPDSEIKESTFGRAPPTA